MGDGTTDDTAAIQAAADAAALLRRPGFGYQAPSVILYFPPTQAYAVSDTITIAHNISVQQESHLLYTGAEDEPCLVIGDPDNYGNNVRYQGLSVQRQVQSDWSEAGPTEENVGIRIYNVYASKVDIDLTQGFTVGAQFYGANGKGFAYNTVTLGSHINNKVAVDITSSNVGWPNENIFIGGRLTNDSGVNTSVDRIGIRITSRDGTYSANNNVFHKPSLEINGQPTSPGEELPILIEYGTENSFQYYRNEGNGTYTARLLNGSTMNYFEAGFDFNNRLDDQSGTSNNVIIHSRQRYHRTHNRLLRRFALGELMNKPRADFTQFRGMSIMEPNSETPALSTSTSGAFTLNSDGSVEIGTGGWYQAVGCLVDTSYLKTLLLTKSVPWGFTGGGRFIVIAYDEAGTALTNSDPNHPYVLGEAGHVPSYIGGGWDAYYEGGDSTYPWLIRVHSDVKSVWVGVQRGTAAATIKSFSVHAALRHGSDGSVTSGLGFANERPLSPGEPNTGTWGIGDMLWNTDPSIDVNGNILMGWVRLTNGSNHVMGTDWAARYVASTSP